MPEYSSPSSVVAAMVLACVFIGVGFFVDPGKEWRALVMVIRLLGVGFMLLTILLALDLMLHRGAERLQEMSGSATYGQRALAAALKGLSQSQSDYVMSHGVSFEIIPGEPPAWYVRCSGGIVPHLFAVDFFRASVQTFPNLYPIRDAGKLGEWAGARRFAEMLTKAVIDAGFAKRGSGPDSAELITSLETVAAWFEVEL